MSIEKKYQSPMGMGYETIKALKADYDFSRYQSPMGMGYGRTHKSPKRPILRINLLWVWDTKCTR